jgi:hypothetical protein
LQQLIAQEDVVVIVAIRGKIEDLLPLNFSELTPAESKTKRKKLWLRISQQLHPDKISDPKLKQEFDDLIKGAATCKEVCNIGGTKPISATED